MTWFERLTGFSETSPDQVRRRIRLGDGVLTSLSNGKTYRYGRLEIPSLGALRDRLGAGKARSGQLAIREIVADVQDLHTDPEHAGALFQVASQFNLLEMISPGVTPEQGIGIYQDDRTQGPVSAIAAGAGTIYRHYFVPIQGQIGQSTAHQIDCLADLGVALGNTDQRWWRMQNGYVFSSHEALVQLSRRLSAANEAERDRLRALVRIGIQWKTQVTLGDCKHTVTQAYCSALPVAYSGLPTELWEPFARLVLEAAYEATLCAAILNAAHTGNRCVLLTMLGGGAFGNPFIWILSAIERALGLYQGHDLDIALVSYDAPNQAVRRLIQDFRAV